MRSNGSQVTAQPARVVEFVGLPGAGKTTAARWLAERLAQDEAKTVILRDIKRDISRLPKLKRVEVVARADRRIWTAAYHGMLAPLSSHRWSKRVRGPFQVADYFLAIDQETGKLSPTGMKAEVPSPVCVMFARPSPSDKPR